MNSLVRFDALRDHCLRLMLAGALSLGVAPSQASSLSDSNIESFIASLHEIRGMFENSIEESLEAELSIDDEDMDMTRIYSLMVEELSNHPPTKQKVSAITERHGFDSLSDWARFGDRIFSAYMAINVEGQPAMAPDAMESYMESLKHLPEAEKKRIQKMMGNAMKSRQTIRNAPAEDIEAVRPYHDEITELHETNKN